MINIISVKTCLFLQKYKHRLINIKCTFNISLFCKKTYLPFCFSLKTLISFFFFMVILSFFSSHYFFFHSYQPPFVFSIFSLSTNYCFSLFLVETLISLLLTPLFLFNFNCSLYTCLGVKGTRVVDFPYFTNKYVPIINNLLIKLLWLT